MQRCMELGRSTCHSPRRPDAPGYADEPQPSRTRSAHPDLLFQVLNGVGHGPGLLGQVYDGLQNPLRLLGVGALVPDHVLELDGQTFVAERVGLLGPLRVSGYGPALGGRKSVCRLLPPQAALMIRIGSPSILP